MAEIQLRNINKRWGSFVGVDNFDLTIADQEFLVLLDPSGCGKTTTMRIIAGLEDATEGDIMIDGKRVNDLDPKDRDVAMVFQSYGLYPHLNVYENIDVTLPEGFSMRAGVQLCLRARTAARVDKPRKEGTAGFWDQAMGKERLRMRSTLPWARF